VDFFALGMFVLWIAMAMSVWSGVDYFVRTLRALRPQPAVKPARRAAI
jgi:phosphatidylglycerophosphate synthase